MRPTIALLVLVAGACAPAGTDAHETDDTTPDAAGPLEVLAVNEPLAYFARRIGGEQVRAEFPGPPDGDPAFWSPDRDTLRRFQAADLVLLNGAGYAKWTERASLPLAREVVTSAAFEDRLIPLEHEVTHSHGPKGEHSHAGTAFTTWLDPTLAVEQARAVLDALVARLPERETLFTERFRELEGELVALDEALAAAVAQDPDRPLVASHPVYQYLARRYSLNLRSVHWEPDSMPDDDAWAELATLLESHPAKWMMWEDDPLPEITTRLEQHGVQSFVLAPTATPPPTGTWLDAMRAGAHALQTAFR